MVFKPNFQIPVFVIFSTKFSALLLKPFPSPNTLYFLHFRLPDNIPFRFANNLLNFLLPPFPKSSLGSHLNLLNVYQALFVLETKSLLLFVYAQFINSFVNGVNYCILVKHFATYIRVFRNTQEFRPTQENRFLTRLILAFWHTTDKLATPFHLITFQFSAPPLPTLNFFSGKVC